MPIRETTSQMETGKKMTSCIAPGATQAKANEAPATAPPKRLSPSTRASK
jgi:hypothetical protein